MCRWSADSGSPIHLDEGFSKPAHSLIDQSRHARRGVETSNGDGFGVGRYEPDRPEPAIFRGVGPAWSDTDLRELAGRIGSPLFLAHLRASTGTGVQESNCHPFRHGRRLRMHNGAIHNFFDLKGELVRAVDPSLYAGCTPRSRPWKASPRTPA
ncbi:class II glutamine amidotransferase [Streptacidiphilus rugosus]